MNTNVHFVRAVITILLILGSPAAFGDDESKQHSYAEAGPMSPSSGSPSDTQITFDRDDTLASAARLGETIRAKTVGEYFRTVAGDDDAEGVANARDWLRNDALNLRGAMRGASPEVRVIAERTLVQVTSELTPSGLATAFKMKDGQSKPLRDWTVTQLATEGDRALRSTSSWTRYLPLAAFAVVTGVASYGAYKLGYANFISGFVLGGFWGAVRAGPLATLMSAGTSWFLKPATEYIEVWNKRHTGEIELRINGVFDRLRFSNAPAEEFDDVRISTIAQDSTNFAGMRPDQQYRNWPKVLGWFTSLNKTYDRLIRKSQHHGRHVMVILWNADLATSHMIEALDAKLLLIDARDEDALSPYRNTFIAANDNVRYNELYDRYEALVEAAVRQPWGEFGPADDEPFSAEVMRLGREMHELGVQPRDVDKIISNQRHRAGVVTVMITTLATNELKYYFYAEANRNMEDDPRNVQRIIHGGLRFQRHVDRHIRPIQRVYQSMGLEAGECEKILQQRGLAKAA